MGLMDKIKNMFTEEEEIEEEPIKKEVIQVEIPSPMTKKEEKPVVEVKEEVIEKPKEIKEKPVERVEKPKQEEKFIFPVYFDDKDFSDLDKAREEKKLRDERKAFEERRRVEEKRVVTKPISESYKGKPTVEEKKTFRPTPIISPVYGVLDKNYTKEDITTKKTEEKPKKLADIDLIRNKAYGSLEDEMIDSLDYKEEKPVHNKDMEEYHKKMNSVDFDELLEADVDDNLDELENKLSKAKAKEEVKEKEVKPKYSRAAKNKSLEAQELNEDDLFDMIDTMYEEGK